MQIDMSKLANLIQRFSDETTGYCTSTGACIGKVDGKQIQLRVVAVEDEEDHDAMSEDPKFFCVTA